MIQLKVKKKITLNFSDDIFSFSHGEESYNYEYDRNEIHIEQLAGETDSGILSSILEPNTRYIVKVWANNISSSSASRFWIMNTDGSNDDYSTSFSNFDITEGNPRFSMIPNIIYGWTSDDSGSVKWEIKGSGSSPSTQYANVNLVKIEFSEIAYTELDILDADNGVQLNKSIKEISEPDKYKITYSNSFKLPMNNTTSDFLNHKNLLSNSNYEYEGVLSEEDSSEIMNGIIIFTSIEDKTIDGVDIIECKMYQKGSDFFEKIKLKNLSDLDIEDGEVNYSNTFNNMNSNNNSYYYNIIDNGQINKNMLNGGNRTVNERSVNGVKMGSYLADFNINDVYPSVYVRELWDKIHSEAGINYSGDFFETDNWKNLLLNDWSNFKKTKEELESLKCSTELNLPYEVITDPSGGYTNPNNTLPTFFRYVDFINPIGSELTSNSYTPTQLRGMKTNLKMDVDINIHVAGNYDRFDEPAGALANYMYCKLKVKISLIPTNLTLGEIINTTLGHYIAVHEEIIELGNTNMLPESTTISIDTEIDYNAFVTSGIYKVRCSFEEIDYWQSQPFDSPNRYIQVYSLEGSGELSLEPTEKIIPNETFSIANVVPKMKQIDFIKNISNLFNLRFVFDEQSNNIEWYTFDEYYMKYSELKDFTNRLDKKKVKKVLGNSWQAKENKIEFKQTKGNEIENYNSAYSLKYASINNKLNGDMEKLENTLINGFGVQPFTYEYNYKLLLTNNTSIVGNIISSIPFREMNTVPFLTYRNIISMDETIIFRNEELNKQPRNILPMSSHIMNPKPATNTGGEVVTLEFMKSNYENSIWRQPTQNQYDLFLENDYQDIIGKNAEKLECQVHLTNYEYSQLKLNDIIQYEDNQYRIDSIKGFNENKLTNLDLIKISFNPHYEGTVYTPAPWISPDPYYNSFHFIVITAPVYTTSVQSFEVSWANLTDDLILTNSTDSNTNKYQYSLDNILFHTLTSGSSFTVSTATSGSQTIYYKLVSATGSNEPGTLYRAYWDLTSDYSNNGILERTTLWCTLKKTDDINVGTTTVKTLDNELNVESGSSNYKENNTTNLD